MARLKHHYDEVVRPALQEKFAYSNPMMVPRLEKIVINMAVGKAVQDRKKLDQAFVELTKISGQKPLLVRARKSVANFKLREGMPIACKATLRRTRMYEFVDRLINIAMPRIRDFRGANPKAFDGRGNYALGLKEQIVFPEINYDDVDETRGMDIVFCTTARTNEEARFLLEGFSLPFAR